MRRRPSMASFDRFLLLLEAHGFPTPQLEVVFAAPRKWRADYCWPEFHVIVEREGGLFSKTLRARMAHGTASSIKRDMEKANAAQLRGYRYLRYTPTQLDSGDALADLSYVLPVAGVRRPPVVGQTAPSPSIG